MTGRIGRTGLSAQIIERQIQEEPSINVKYPEVRGLPNRQVQNKINSDIKKIVDDLMIVQGYGKEDLAEMIGLYTIGLNKEGLLSIKFENYSIFDMAAHGLNVIRSYTADLRTGEVYELYQLFRPKSPYKIIISTWMRRDIIRRDLPMLVEFRRINDDQDYYLTEKHLVIYWQRYEFTAGYAGEPEFFIPYTILANMVPKGSPLYKIIN